MSTSNNDSTSDFDRSFEAYAEHPPLFETTATNPNKPSDVVKESTDDTNNNNKQTEVVVEEEVDDDDGELDVSFDSEDAFPATIASARSAVLSALQEQQQAADESSPPIHVTLHEELSAVYDETTAGTAITPVIAVTGSVRVSSAGNSSSTRYSPTDSSTAASVVLRDPGGAIARVEPVAAYCTACDEQHIPNPMSPLEDPTTQHRLQLEQLTSDESVLVARYMCTAKLQPVPLVRT